MVNSGVNVPAVVLSTFGGLIVIALLVWWAKYNLGNKKQNAALLEEVYKQIPKSTIVPLAGSARRQFGFLAVYLLILEGITFAGTLLPNLSVHKAVDPGAVVAFAVVTIIFVYFMIRYTQYAVTGKIPFGQLSVHGRFDYYRKMKMANAPAPAIKQ